MNSKISFKTDIPVYAECDVVVCGGGPSGCAAALAARREGLRVVLIEGMGQLGGMAITGLVSQWLGGRTQEGEWVVGGIFRSLSEEATAKGYAVLPSLDQNKKYHPYGWYNWFIHGVPLDPFSVDLFLDQKMRDADVSVLLHTEVMDATVSNGNIDHVVIHNRSGMQAIKTKAVIDATGNADIAFRTNCETIKGRREDGKMTPASLTFHVYNVDEEKLTRFIEQENDPKLRKLILRLRETGEWTFPAEIFIATRLVREGEFYINTTRLIGVDGTDGDSISNGMQRGRTEVHELFDLFKRHIPGFENAGIKSIAPQMGIRETRRIIGDFILTVEDLTEDRDFDDCIGFSMYGWDLPDPDKPAHQPFASDTTAGYKYKVKKGLSTPLPYRIMIPRPVKNLICPGRAVSVEGQVLGPVRVMAPCMAMGEAAGVASVQVVKNQLSFADVSVDLLRQRLREVGALVDKDQLPKIYPRVDQV